MINERNTTYRQVFTDNRALPIDPTPSWNGYLSGNCEGDALVVRTIGFRDHLWLDLAGNLLTSAAIVTEEFRRPDFGRLEIRVTVDDSKAYTKPWTVTPKQAFVVDTDLVDDVCLENEKSASRLRQCGPPICRRVQVAEAACRLRPASSCSASRA